MAEGGGDGLNGGKGRQGDSEGEEEKIKDRYSSDLDLFDFSRLNFLRSLGAVG